MRTLLTMRTSTSIVGKDKGGTGHTLNASEAKSDGARCASGTYADRFGVYRSTTARACASTQAIARPDLLTSFADAGFVALAATRLEEDFFLLDPRRPRIAQNQVGGFYPPPPTPRSPPCLKDSLCGAWQRL